MTLWIILTLLACAACVMLTIPMVRRYEMPADSARSDVRPVAERWRVLAVVSTTGFVTLGGTLLYRELGSNQDSGAWQNPGAAPVAVAQAAAPQVNAASDVDQLVRKLEAKLTTDPGNAEGWRMLGWSYFNMQRYDEAVQAYGKAVARDPVNLDYKAALGEALVQAAQGVVPPQARDMFLAVLAADPKNQIARFYRALGEEQAGQTAAALDHWLELLADAPADAGWIADAKAHISELGNASGRDVSGALAVAQAKLTAAVPAPGTDPVIAGMIGKLRAKLAGDPQDRDGWAMLIRSLKTQRDDAGAAQALDQATAIFKNDPATLAVLKGIRDGTAQAPQVPPEAASAGGGSVGPALSPEQMASVQSMPADQQKDMINSMVERLAARLESNPRDAEGWIRLMRARSVQGMTDKAVTALNRSLTVFADDAAATAQLQTAARELGLPTP